MIEARRDAKVWYGGNALYLDSFFLMNGFVKRKGLIYSIKNDKNLTDRCREIFDINMGGFIL